MTDDVADALRRLKHRGGIHQRFSLAGLRILPALAQDADRRLTDGEVAGGGDRHDALARPGQDVELAEGRDVIDASIGTGIGKHHEAVAHQDAAAIGHDVSTRSCPAGWAIYRCGWRTGNLP